MTITEILQSFIAGDIPPGILVVAENGILFIGLSETECKLLSGDAERCDTCQLSPECCAQ